MAQPAHINYEDAPFLPVHKKITLGVYLGQISDGYTLCVVGTALTLATTHLGLTSFWMGAIGAGALLGILFGSLCLGPLSDKFGRKPLFILSMLLFSIVTAIQFFISDPLTLVATRFLIGACIGMDYTSSPSLLTEWVPRRLSPRLLGSFLILWMTGFVFAYFIGIAMPDFGENTWRWILVSPLLPSSLAFLWRLCSGIPESPRWLASKGRAEEGQELIRKHLGPEYYMTANLETEAVSTSWFQLFSKDQWRASLTAGIFYATQVFPFFGIGIFLPMVLADMNMAGQLAPGIIYNLFMIIGVLVGVWLIEKISRSTFLLTTFYASALLMSIIALWQGMPTNLLIVMLTLFSFILNIGIVLENPYPAELFPTHLRASGVGFATAVSRIGAAAGTFLLPVINEQCGIYVTLGGCAISLWLGGIVCQAWAPETSQKFK